MPGTVYDDGDSNVLTRDKIRKPSMYTIVFFNDDFTTMEFVVHMMTSICNIPLEEATIAMIKVHKEGKANVGRYTWEVAETMCYAVISAARRIESPLLVQPEEIE